MILTHQTLETVMSHVRQGLMHAVAEQRDVQFHLNAGMRDVTQWGDEFQSFEPTDRKTFTIEIGPARVETSMIIDSVRHNIYNLKASRNFNEEWFLEFKMEREALHRHIKQGASRQEPFKVRFSLAGISHTGVGLVTSFETLPNLCNVRFRGFGKVTNPVDFSKNTNNA